MLQARITFPTIAITIVTLAAPKAEPADIAFGADAGPSDPVGPGTVPAVSGIGAIEDEGDIKGAIEDEGVIEGGMKDEGDIEGELIEGEVKEGAIEGERGAIKGEDIEGIGEIIGVATTGFLLLGDSTTSIIFCPFMHF